MIDPATSVESYRIEQIEKEIQILKDSSKLLNFDQIKQMCRWIGLPVAVATGVFGAALWTLLERTTVTAAERRAEAKVNELTARIDSLETQITDLADKSQMTLLNLHEFSGRAEEASNSLSSRAYEAGQRALEAEQELGKLRTTIAAAEEVQKAFTQTNSIADSLAGNENFQQVIGQIAFKDLFGLVVAFDRESGCPAGWSPFQQGAGRFVVGVGEGPGLSARAWREVGGEESHVLLPEEMPRHTHTFKGNSVPRGGWGGQMTNPVAGGGSQVADNGAYTPKGSISAQGGKGDGKTAAHNTMPPYVALYFCVRNER
ncbi:hypothetical protein [Amaricoccus sp.]|uniref:hypothetical protein n=1 Tax=Amaricoccus sp. TaxID=1872485 RepID=UPI001B5065BE|nr:hypothetical protein [Amaricoccus sp.]MBP7002343.1 hypothetical protein [Amaricoccus sp.]